MQTSPTFTNQVMGLDSKVWIAMLSVTILIGLVSFIRRDEPCIPFTISNKGLNTNNKGEYYIGDRIRFTASITDNKNITWNFGDNSQEQKGSLVSHNYAKKGKYVITAKVNGNCLATTSVYIRTLQDIHIHSHDDSSTAVHDPATVIVGNETPKARKEVIYIGNVLASSYEWTILNRNEYKRQNGKTASYTFSVQGEYTLQLKLDNDREKVYRKTIYVQPPEIAGQPLKTKILKKKKVERKQDQNQTAEKEDSAASPPVNNTTVPKTTREETKIPTTIGLPDEAFKSALEEVINGNRDVNSFNKYLNNGGDTKVRVNNESKAISFTELIQRIKGKGSRKVRIRNVKVLRDTNKDVLQINIVYETKGLWGWR